MQAPLGGPWSQGMELAAAVCSAGGLGSVPTALRDAGQVRADVARLREMTDRPFAVNMTRRLFEQEVFEAVLALSPAVFSYALGDPGDLVARVHDVGSVFLQQVTNVEQALRAAEAGVDVISAQGTESGAFSGSVATMPLVPQVVDAVSPIPVLASGGIADGRGLAAALALGAQGVNIGTRFLVSAECAVPEEWKLAVIAAASQEAVKVDFEHILPRLADGGYDTLPRSLATPFVTQWNSRLEATTTHAAELTAQFTSAIQAGTAHELVLFAGQTAGLIHGVERAADIVARMIAEADAILARLATGY